MGTEDTRGATPSHSCLPPTRTGFPQAQDSGVAGMDRKGEDGATRNQRIRKQESRGVLQNQALGGEV